MGIQKVELLGNESWWSQNGGSLVLAVAAVLAAGLAAFVAVHNTRRQLDHDRELRNRDHIRETIDAAIAVLSEAVNAASVFYTLLRRTEDHREAMTKHVREITVLNETSMAMRATLMEMQEELSVKDQALDAALIATRPMNIRLITRIGEDHPLRLAFKATLDAARDFHQHSVGDLDEGRPPTLRPGDRERAASIANAFKTFQNTCYSWFNE